MDSLSYLVNVLQGPVTQCHGFFSTLNIVGCVCVLILGGGWFGVGYGRKSLMKDIVEKKKNNPFSFIWPVLDDFHSDRMRKLPQVSVVMACKGVHAHSLDNWNTQLHTIYGGGAEYVFIVESEEDEAYAAIKGLLEKEEYSDHKAQVLVAGISWHNSQKIHNVLEGIAHTSDSSKYILILDDDIQLHPGTVRALVHELEEDPKVFASGGYSLDLPHPASHGRFVEYLLMIYRMINLAGFGSDRPHFMWGGCMMIRRDDCLNNRYNIIDVWTDGGHSEDMLSTGLAMQEGRTIAVPWCGIFLEYLSPTVTFTSYVNFVLRQLFVCDTYASVYHRRKHLALLWLTTYASMLIVLPFIGAIIQLSAWIWRAITMSPTNSLDIATTGLCLPATVTMVALLVLSLVTLLVLCPYMLHSLTDLCNVLSPKDKLAEYPKMNWIKFYLAFWVHGFVMVYGALWVLLHDTVVWSGTAYTKMKGRIGKMTRTDKDGRPYSVPAAESLDRTIRHYKEDLNFPPKERFRYEDDSTFFDKAK